MQTDNAAVAKLIEDMVQGNNTGTRLVLNPNSGKLEKITRYNEKPDNVIEITADEANMFGISKTILVITKEEIAEVLEKCGMEKKGKTGFKLCPVDGTDVFRVDANGSKTAKFYDVTDAASLEEEVLRADSKEDEVVIFFNHKDNSIKSYWNNKGDCRELEVIIPPVKEELFSRINGIYETSVLSAQKVAIIGLGSGGSPIALELAKQGVQHFFLADPDRLEIANISRHVCGISDLGRYKTKAVKALIKNKNPYADIITLEEDITELTEGEKERFLNDVNLVICCTDNRESKLIINRFCIEHNLVCIYGGAFRRAYGGQVLRVIPHKTMCYQCYISYMPDLEEDHEISSSRQTARVAYSDIPDVPIEPGLSTDIAPISTFIVKLAILELLKGCRHTMESLYEDMEASLYLWFNRREPGTKWEKVISPMEYSTDKMSVLRWYGVHTQKNKKCPVCGKYLGDPKQEEIDFFK